MGYPDGVELSLVSDDPDDRAVRIQHHEERFVFRLGCHVPSQTDYFFVGTGAGLADKTPGTCIDSPICRAVVAVSRSTNWEALEEEPDPPPITTSGTIR